MAQFGKPRMPRPRRVRRSRGRMGWWEAYCRVNCARPADKLDRGRATSVMNAGLPRDAHVRVTDRTGQQCVTNREDYLVAGNRELTYLVAPQRAWGGRIAACLNSQKLILVC